MTNDGREEIELFRDIEAKLRSGDYTNSDVIDAVARHADKMFRYRPDTAFLLGASLGMKLSRVMLHAAKKSA
jgi:hypothetical protein